MKIKEVYMEIEELLNAGVNPKRVSILVGVPFMSVMQVAYDLSARMNQEDHQETPY